MEEKEITRLENLDQFEFECHRCEAVLSVNAYQRDTMLKACPNCGALFECDEFDDPVAHIQKAILSLKKVHGVTLRLVCKEGEDG
jgi:transcription elongation factor Elf1